MIPRWMVSVADQGVVALTNLAISVAVARVGGLKALGTYAIISTTLLISLGIFRMLVTEPWLLLKGDEAPPPQFSGIVIVSALGCSTAGAIAAATGGSASWYWASLVGAAWIPQDAARFIMFKRNNPARALLSDSLLLATVLVAAMLIVAVEPDPRLAHFLAAWALGQVLALVAIAGALQGGISVRGAGRWWNRTCRRSALALTHDGLAYMAANNVSLYLLAAVSSAVQVGLVRVVSSVFSPIALAFTGLNMWLVPLLARSSHNDAVRKQRTVSVALLALSVPTLVIAVAFGPQVATLVFGNEVAPPRLAILFGGLSTCLVAVGSPWVAGAKVQGRYGPVALTRSVAAVVILGSLVMIPAVRTVEGYLMLILVQNMGVVTVAYAVQEPRHPSSPQAAVQSRSGNSS